MNKINFLRGLSLVFGVALMTVSCGDDDNLKRQYYSFDGQKREIATVARKVGTEQPEAAIGEGRRDHHYFYMFDNKALEQGADFSMYIMVTSSNLGSDINVTGLPSGCDFAFIDSATGERYNTDQGGRQVSDMASGRFNVRSLGGGKFEIVADVVFVDGKSLKVNYTGTPFLEVDDLLD